MDSQPALDECLAHLKDEPIIAVDTEADSFFSYRESVCLIQVTAGGRDFVIDPLAKINLDGFGAVLADPKRVKLFHDGEYDVLIFKRSYGFKFANIFDTRIAAAATGSKTPGLASVMEEHFGVKLDKSQQRSDWSKRPLTTKQIQYARLDTHYLIPLYERQRVALKEMNREVLFDGECRRLEALEPPDRPFNADEFARIKGARKLRSDAWSPLRELYIWREKESERRNLPPFKVLGNPGLLDLAAAFPLTINELKGVHSIPEKVRRRHSDALLDALNRAYDNGPIEQFPRLAPKDGTGGFDDHDHELHERVKVWRRSRAEREDLDSSLVLHRTTLLSIARNRPTTREQIAELDGIVAWQIDEYTQELTDVVAKFNADLASGSLSQSRRRRPRRG